MIKRPEYNMLKTGEQIRKLRKERNISVEQIRRYLQFESTQAIYKWEKGKCFPQADNLMALARLFDVNPEDIMVEDRRDIYRNMMKMILRFIELKKKQRYRPEVVMRINNSFNS